MVRRTGFVQLDPQGRFHLLRPVLGNLTAPKAVAAAGVHAEYDGTREAELFTEDATVMRDGGDGQGRGRMGHNGLYTLHVNQGERNSAHHIRGF